MLLRRELCNLKDPQEGEICLKIAGESLKNSEYALVGGLRSAYYFDLDNVICERKYVSALVDLLSKKINQLSMEYAFDKIAFIDKGGIGPIGLITLFGVLSVAVEKNFIIVRPLKQTLRSAIKGAFNKGDRVLLLSDVATTGRTIFEAAEKIWACGGKVPYALVVIDRCQGAVTNLGRKGIELFSLFSAKTMKEEKDDELKNQYNRTIFPNFEPQLVDFGGSAATIFG